MSAIRSGGNPLSKRTICYVLFLLPQTDLSIDAFLNVFIRFIGRRGLPETMFSDNATNFVGASNVLKVL